MSRKNACLVTPSVSSACLVLMPSRIRAITRRKIGRVTVLGAPSLGLMMVTSGTAETSTAGVVPVYWPTLSAVTGDSSAATLACFPALVGESFDVRGKPRPASHHPALLLGRLQLLLGDRLARRHSEVPV